MGSSGKEIIECEVKISLADLKQDYVKRKHNVYRNIKSYNRWCPNKFYFAVPQHLSQDAIAITKGTPYGVMVVDAYPLSLDYSNRHKYVRVVKTASKLQAKLSGCLEHRILLRMSSHYTKILTSGLVSDTRDRFKVCGIYKITNNDAGKIYIGNSSDMFSAWETHKTDLERGIHHNRCMQKDFSKGNRDISFSVLEYSASVSYLKSDEFKWVDYYSVLGEAGYNIPPIIKGTPISEREKIFVKHSIKNNSRYKLLPEKIKESIRNIYRKENMEVSAIAKLTGLSEMMINSTLDESTVPCESKFFDIVLYDYCLGKCGNPTKANEMYNSLS